MPFSISYGNLNPLSAAQRQFAQEHHATAGLRAGADRRSVFMYSDDGRKTYRWLVDPAGWVLDFTVFRYSGWARCGRFLRGAGDPRLGHAAALPRWPVSPASRHSASASRWVTLWVSPRS